MYEYVMYCKNCMCVVPRRSSYTYYCPFCGKVEDASGVYYDFDTRKWVVDAPKEVITRKYLFGLFTTTKVISEGFGHWEYTSGKNICDKPLQ